MAGTKQAALVAALLLSPLAAGACAAEKAVEENAAAEPSRDEARAAILDLNRRLMQSQIVERDAALLLERSSPNFVVLAPGGKVEGLEAAAKGVAAWDVESIDMSGEEVIFHSDDLAIVTGRVDIDGTMAPVGRWGPLKYMAVYAREEGQWIYVSRAVTPCLDKAIEFGIC